LEQIESVEPHPEFGRALVKAGRCRVWSMKRVRKHSIFPDNEVGYRAVLGHCTKKLQP
jgi:hypothetical protein